MPEKLVVVGGGRVGSALVGGLIRSSWASPEDLTVVEPDPTRRAFLAETHPGVRLDAVLEPNRLEQECTVLLAVKPDIAEAVLLHLRPAHIGRVISVVAGLACARLEAALADGAVVIRAMPNMGVFVGVGATAICGGSHVTGADLDLAEEIFSAVGTVVRLPERHLDAVTGLSGSGPAYVFMVAEALIDAGVLSGLPRDTSRTLVVQTILGSAQLMAAGEEPETLRAAVTSPGGTTAAGLRALEARAVRSAFLEAVASATERSRQLGH
jgi:pyrroline-5-carboxylate reductase